MTDYSETLSPRAQRAAKRRERMEVHLSSGFAEADEWDLKYWQSRTPQERLEAFLAIRKDVEKVEKARAGQC